MIDFDPVPFIWVAEPSAPPSLETDAEILAAYPRVPPKRLLRWRDTRVAVTLAGEAWVRSGRVRGSAEDRALWEAEEAEERAHREAFGI